MKALLREHNEIVSDFQQQDTPHLTVLTAVQRDKSSFKFNKNSTPLQKSTKSGNTT